jgi:hypothetical protein
MEVTPADPVVEFKAYGLDDGFSKLLRQYEGQTN